ncbi:2-hydroxychromene-2-carboxylate isomerase [Marinospirillum celere]|uniref:2-hydroxychromene-2-carboxylate isomerase n=1 Tax=Marinospirillum celere TaxID=1122252 RepID=A0A1I1GLW6_9GAMM|nr:2-hydroxychromene-2-carboxylate isomerase [Marinospirillum celere]SFC12435.1 2-hydroxychromene-2-carboxylate isomerase [Marinospirillum celere]
MSEKIDFYYDIVSPYSYLAAVQLAELEKKTGAEVTWRPIFLGGLFKEIGNKAPLSLESKKRYMFSEDLPRLARYYQVPYTFPEVFPTNTLKVQRALAALPATERPALSLQLFDLYWGQGQDLGQPEVALEALGTKIAGLADEEVAKTALKDFTAEAISRGAFGAPTLIWKDKIYFGSDRIHLLEADLLSS